MEIEVNDRDVLWSLEKRALRNPDEPIEIGGAVYPIRHVYERSLTDPTFRQTASQEITTRYLSADLEAHGA
jgi:hypothetical protein